jgi:hypothetical protein
VTINLRALLPNRSLGLLVQADQAIAVERVLYWGDGLGSGKYGSAVSAGVSGPAALWSFPFSSTSNGDQVFLSFTNPTTVEAHVRISLYGATGQISETTPITATIEPSARATIALPAQPRGQNAALGVVLTSDVPVVSEEAQYFGGSPNVGNHTGSVLPGMAQPGMHWVFPGFNSANFAAEQWYVLNTGASEARLTATLYNAAGSPLVVQFKAGPNRLTSITLQNLHDLQSGASSSWSSSVPVSIVQVLHSSAASQGAVVAGILQDKPGAS